MVDVVQTAVGNAATASARWSFLSKYTELCQCGVRQKKKGALHDCIFFVLFFLFFFFFLAKSRYYLDTILPEFSSIMSNFPAVTCYISKKANTQYIILH